VSALERMHSDDLAVLADLIAERVAARLGAAPRLEAAPTLLTAAEVAQRHGVSPAWVRENADRLRVIRLGNGPRPRLRFDAEKVAAALTPCEPSKRSSPEKSASGRARRRPAQLRSGSGPGVLPVFMLDSPESDK
jgi:hypothetical protein